MKEIKLPMKKSFLEFKNYKSFFKKIDIIVDHKERKKLIFNIV